jgi:hypothetical protein
MTEDDRAIVQDISQRLKVISEELSELEKRLGGSAIEKAVSAADIASAWLDLFISRILDP